MFTQILQGSFLCVCVYIQMLNAYHAHVCTHALAIVMTCLHVSGVAQGIITGIRGLCNGLGPALFGFVFYLFHVNLNEHKDKNAEMPQANNFSMPYVQGSLKVGVCVVMGGAGGGGGGGGRKRDKTRQDKFFISEGSE